MDQDEQPTEASLALAIRAASRSVYDGWSVPVDSHSTGEQAHRAAEAQVVAAAAGRKPLYFDPWGEELSRAFAEAYRSVLPLEAKAWSRGDLLFVHRAEVVRPILDADPGFYRLEGETEEDSIYRVSEQSENGELLGYGARSTLVRPAHEVRIFRGDDLLLYYFVSTADSNIAEVYARERAMDFVRAFGWEDIAVTLERIE